jgi:hypothetical protein
VPISHSFELTEREEASVLIGYAVGVLLAQGVSVTEVQAFIMKQVDSSLCDAQLNGLKNRTGV